MAVDGKSYRGKGSLNVDAGVRTSLEIYLLNNEGDPIASTTVKTTLFYRFRGFSVGTGNDARHYDLREFLIDEKPSGYNSSYDVTPRVNVKNPDGNYPSDYRNKDFPNSYIVYFEIDADDITENMTILVNTVDNIDAETAKNSGYIKISTGNTREKKKKVLPKATIDLSSEEADALKAKEELINLY
jgi:hypothetical protein